MQGSTTHIGSQLGVNVHVTNPSEIGGVFGCTIAPTSMSDLSLAVTVFDAPNVSYYLNETNASGEGLGYGFDPTTEIVTEAVLEDALTRD